MEGKVVLGIHFSKTIIHIEDSMGGVVMRGLLDKPWGGYLVQIECYQINQTLVLSDFRSCSF
jgi:hypothetical protein